MPREKSLWGITLMGALACATGLGAEPDKKTEVSSKKDTSAAPAVDRYRVPDGDVAALLKFVEALQQYRPDSAESAEEHQRKLPGALKQAAEKILTLEKDRQSEAYLTAKFLLLQSELPSLPQAAPSEQRAIYERIKTHVSETKKPSRRELVLAYLTLNLLERSAEEKLVLEAYRTFGELFVKSDEEELADMGKRFAGSARRMSLVGNEMALEGSKFDGSSFDWKSYRGKVVLVDFWATWCGPCVAELPNVRKNYDAYRERGFDVVGISLDRDRERLDGFLKAEQLPWVCLYADGLEGDHPMATYYGINAIPSTMLVGKDGKVIALNVRGPALGRELERLLGPAETKVGESPKSSGTAPIVNP